jgi:hypothetical protein
MLNYMLCKLQCVCACVHLRLVHALGLEARRQGNVGCGVIGLLLLLLLLLLLRVLLLLLRVLLLLLLRVGLGVPGRGSHWGSHGVLTLLALLTLLTHRGSHGWSLLLLLLLHVRRGLHVLLLHVRRLLHVGWLLHLRWPL